MKTELLRIENLFGSYIERVILDQVAFSIFKGDMVCLFGFNNSGKTTIVNILSGEIEGKWRKNIYYCGLPVSLDSKEDAHRIGVYCVSSQSKLFRNLSISENLFLINMPWNQRLDANYIPTNLCTAEILKKYKIDISPTELVSNLTEAEQCLIEIIMAVNARANLIVLDCMPAFSSSASLAQLKNLLYMLREEGISILYTCDTLNKDMLFSDRMIILRKGLKVKELTGPVYNLREISLFATGFKPDYAIQSEKKLDTPVLMNLKNVNLNGTNFSLDICRCETLGIHHDNKEVLFEFSNALKDGNLSCSDILMNGSHVSSFSLAKWMKKKSCVVSDLSSDMCIFPNLSILENITIGIPWHGFISGKIEELVYAENKKLIDTAERCRLNGSDSSTINIAIFVRRLQLQKVELVVFLKPEMGLDPVSQNKMFLEISTLNDYGITVLILSNELGAIASVCNRIVSI